MRNFLLDAMPDTYQGYLIRTDYRIGIQISQALEDEDLSPQERLAVSVDLLFGAGVPPEEMAIGGVQWFMLAGKEPETGHRDPDGVQYFSFDYDDARIYSAFRRAYGIDLDRVTMHWFRFLALLGDLGECAFTQIVGVRSADLSKLDKETKKAYLKLRRKYALPQKESEESREFMEQLGGE